MTPHRADRAIVGPGVQVVTFTTPTEPGSYLFVCELHPIR